ncbi:MAG: iron-sulfur cluster assembly scaffold protein [Pseudomonadota bacterium]
MSDDPLYRREILRLAADARGAGHLTAPDASASAHNPACGDRVTVELALEKGRIIALAHQTQACVLTQASAALLAEMAAGQDREGLARLASGIRGMLAGGAVPAPGYAAFDGVAAYPGRHVCVLLPLEAALRALETPEPGGAGTKRQS